jgi:hypothetical protein
MDAGGNWGQAPMEKGYRPDIIVLYAHAADNRTRLTYPKFDEYASMGSIVDT